MRRKTILSAVIVLATALVAVAATRTGMVDPDNYADIKFDTLTINLGRFHASDGKQTCTFTFTNVGNAPLVINQANTTCGCTVAQYTKTPVQPGESGTIDVSYNGKGKMPGHFKKTITVRSNAKKEMTRLTIEGDMLSE